ncbi:hypothetical protein [Agrobacterium rosae]|uniref:hypothetical protein n=1 Tax=Agrobacterium rosae TaxID=1972867 RepID=UPI001297FA9C|nr:hypothetical protein [Agrobacterium rosae]
MKEFTFENIIKHSEVRDEYFHQYDRLIGELKTKGYYDAAIIHARNKNRIYAEIALLL